MPGEEARRKVLAAGFDRDAADRLSAVLRDAGYHVLGATGRTSSRTLARLVVPDVLLVPAGEAGREARAWVEDLVGDARVVAVRGDASDVEVVEALRAGGAAGPDAAEAAPAPSSEALPPAGGALPPGRPPRPPTDRAVTAPLGEALAGPPREARPVPAPSAPAEVARLPAPAGALTARPPAPGGALAPSPPGLAGAPAVDEGTARLGAKLAHVRFGDYHAVLEVQPGATAYVIREQHQRLATLYSPTGWPGAVRAEDLPVLDEIGRGIEEAFSVLGDPELRARYERALERTRAAPPPRS